MADLVELQVDLHFEAAHRLPNVPVGHKCARLHGHSFHCTVTVQGAMGEESGWLMDYADIRETLEPIKERLDHRFLNEVEGLENPTSENIARWIWSRLQGSLEGLSAVTVRETCNARCIYRGKTQ